VYIIGAESLAGGKGYWLMGAPDAVMAKVANISEADEATYNLLRIEAGYGDASGEFTEDYIPLEAGLWDIVSFTKGCYTGQEIIARMESRRQLAKMLVRLQSDTPIPTELQADGAKVGTLTSQAQHPQGYFLGLGYVKTGVLDEGIPLTTSEGSEIKIL